MHTRKINILKQKSFFLFGARATGKSFLLRELFTDKIGSRRIIWIDLLSNKEFLRYRKNPSLLYEECLQLCRSIPITNEKDNNLWVVIDEVQRVPELLNEVHRIIESREFSQRILFALTGSSARKLKRGGANLLAGRALVNNLFPLTASELGTNFNLNTVINWGSLPPVINSSDDLIREETLISYFATYLREEIKEEQVVRNLDPFVRFLEAAAQTSGKIVNYSKIAREGNVDGKAVSRYYQILEDTLLGIFLPSYHRSVRKQQTKSPKFYFFDLGVQRAIEGKITIPVTEQSYEYGNLFEQLFILEVYRLNSYLRTRYKLSYLRSKDGAEIDLIVEAPTKKIFLIEIKSSHSAKELDNKHIEKFLPNFDNATGWVVSRDKKDRIVGNTRFIHWQTALSELFKG